MSIAAHDLKARLLGIPVYDLLGGKRRDRIPICYPIFRLKSRDDVSDRVRLVKEQFNEGFTAFRFYFGHCTEADEQLLETICGEFGSKIQLTSLDGSGLFTLPAFLRAYKRLARFPFESIESPVEREDIEAIAEARRAIDHPVSEHIRSLEYALRCIKLRAVDIFNISITVAGGISGMMKLFALAEAANIECLIGTTQELSIATAAQAHVGAAAVRLDYASDPVGPCLYTADVTRESSRFENGDLLVPEGIGLGVEVDEKKIEAISDSAQFRQRCADQFHARLKMPLPRLRWLILSLLFLSTVINYVDRQALSVLLPTLRGELGISSAEYGTITTLFLTAYTIGQLFAGIVIDRIGTRRGFAVSIILWSLAAIAHAFARGPLSFGLLRFALGIGEAGNWPAGGQSRRAMVSATSARLRDGGL